MFFHCLSEKVLESLLRPLTLGDLLLPLSLLAFIILAGCATTTEYVPVPIAVPAPPTYPTIKAEELQCLSDDAYTRIVKRDRLRASYAEELVAIIRATQSK